MSDIIKIQSKVRDYFVYFREGIASDIKRACENGSFFVIDSRVYKLYGNLFLLLPEERIIILEPTEDNKSLDKSKELIEILIERRIRKNNTLVAIGGGITQDITAFTASILYRGIEWEFVPTTLLAQGDSCIGSKTSINAGKSKNLVGNFYPPSAVFIEMKFLDTLDDMDIKSGIGEMMHFYIYANSRSLEKIVSHYRELISDRSKLREYILESLLIKKSVVEVDEYDKGERNKFNYGHTFGHALEAITNYEIRHGQAVTVGMDLANYISTIYGVMENKTFDALHRLLKINIPEYSYNKINMDQYFEALSKDKKNLGEDLVCILAERLGCLLKRRMKMDNRLRKAISTYYREILSSSI